MVFSEAIFDMSVKVKPSNIHIGARDKKEEPSIGIRPMILPAGIFSIDFTLRSNKMFKGNMRKVIVCMAERSPSPIRSFSTSLPARKLPRAIQKSQLASIMPRDSSLP